MGREKGAANLAAFNSKRSENILPKIIEQLQICKKRKLYFKSVGLLASYLSEIIGVHRTTLTRNNDYRLKLLEHVGTQPGSVNRAPDSILDPHILQIKLASSQLEASNLRSELKKVLASLNKAQSLDTIDSRSDVDFANLAMCLVNILSRLNDLIEIDFDKRSIIDLTAKPSDKLIVGVERVGVFLSWLEQNQYIPMVAHLVKTNKI